jgi:hypothetical protein
LGCSFEAAQSVCLLHGGLHGPKHLLAQTYGILTVGQIGLEAQLPERLRWRLD